MSSYPNATERYRKALAELLFRADKGVPSIYCPATGKLVAPNVQSPESLEDLEQRLANVETVLFAYDHESGEFIYQSKPVQDSIERIRARATEVSEKSDFDVLIENTPDFGDGFLVLDIEQRAAGGHHSCLTIGFDLAAAVIG